MEPDQILAENVRRLRKQKGLSQEQLAHAAGLTARLIGKIEAVDTDVKLSNLARVAAGLGVEIGDLFAKA